MSLIAFLTSILLSSLFVSSESSRVHHRNDYAFVYSEKYELPVYVKYTINKSDVEGPYKRTNKFSQDTSITSLSSHPRDYKRSGYDRGHMKPAAVSTGSRLDMQESFLMSNICPQVPEFNRVGWKKIEAEVRSLMRSQDSVIVYTGPVLTGIDTFIGPDSVGVPKYFFKTVLLGDSARAFGYLCPHEKLDKDVSRYIVSIDSIESVIGIDLYPGLSEDLELKF